MVAPWSTWTAQRTVLKKQMLAKFLQRKLSGVRGTKHEHKSVSISYYYIGTPTLNGCQPFSPVIRLNAGPPRFKLGLMAFLLSVSQFAILAGAKIFGLAASTGVVVDVALGRLLSLQKAMLGLLTVPA